MPAELYVTSSAFAEGGKIPVEHTGHGADGSPELLLSEFVPGAGSIAVLLDDVSHPLFRCYNHWLVWNFPLMRRIPANLPHGRQPEALGGAVQGIGYGRHRYRGPKPPFGATHQYRFTVFVLDCMLQLPANTRKAGLLRAMHGHVLQQGSLTGVYR